MARPKGSKNKPKIAEAEDTVEEIIAPINPSGHYESPEALIERWSALPFQNPQLVGQDMKAVLAERPIIPDRLRLYRCLLEARLIACQVYEESSSINDVLDSLLGNIKYDILG